MIVCDTLYYKRSPVTEKLYSWGRKQEGDTMGKKYENISPAIFALPCLLIMEAIHAAHIIPQDHIKDFQLISNTLLLIIGVYSLSSARVQTNHFKSSTLVYFLSNSLVVLCGYILNIDVFENKIHQISDLWTKWHILWLIGSLVLKI